MKNDLSCFKIRTVDLMIGGSEDQKIVCNIYIILEKNCFSSYPNSPVSKACSTFDSLTASSTSPLMQLSSPIADTIATAAAVNGTTPQSQQQQWRPVLQNGAYHQQQVF